MKPTRRGFLLSSALPAIAAAPPRPNILFMITDDQGYGDLSLHGNPDLQTPHIDSIARAGVRFTQFQVSPVCSPTRSSLMTGRYNYRTGVVDTYLGRSMMYPDEVTLPEKLAAAGYRTGIFGKWHLGDVYPLRAIDQGFQEALVCTGGGLTQPSDPPGNRYFDPILQHNGNPEKAAGYCTDIFFGAAARFIEENRRRPFFAYVAANAPHEPLEIAESYAAPFRSRGLDDRTAKVYGMVKNIDDNIGKLLGRLKSLGLERDTIVIFMTDNGPQHERFNAGMRGIKGSVYQGGIRVPFFLRWPRAVKPASTSNRIAAHIDVFPTLLEACGVSTAGGPAVDGVSLMPLLRGSPANWPDRTLFTQWHRGDEPQPFRNCAVRTQRHKLVDGNELYDLEADPAEQRDLAAQHPEIVDRMRKSYDRWFADVSATRGYAPPRMILGTSHQNPVTLTRQDWRGEKAGWAADSLGHWEVEVGAAGRYQVTLRLPPSQSAATAHFLFNEVRISASVPPGATQASFPSVELPARKGRFEAWLETSAGAKTGVLYVDVERKSP